MIPLISLRNAHKSGGGLYQDSLVRLFTGYLQTILNVFSEIEKVLEIFPTTKKDTITEANWK